MRGGAKEKREVSEDEGGKEEEWDLGDSTGM